MGIEAHFSNPPPLRQASPPPPPARSNVQVALLTCTATTMCTIFGLHTSRLGYQQWHIGSHGTDCLHEVFLKNSRNMATILCNCARHLRRLSVARSWQSFGQDCLSNKVALVMTSSSGKNSFKACCTCYKISVKQVSTEST